MLLTAARERVDGSTAGCRGKLVERSSNVRAIFQHFVDDSARLDQLVADADRFSQQPNQLEQSLNSYLPATVRCDVNGTIDNRVVLLSSSSEAWYLGSIDRTICESGLREAQAFKMLGQLSAHLMLIEADPLLLKRFTSPRVLLVGLYHPENFPLPRFHLGISDIAYAIRGVFLGKVELLDMQLNVDVPEILERISRQRPDIIGISATFGQHDKLDGLLQGIGSFPGYSPTIVCGGSLSVLISKQLLQSYENIIIGNGPGEMTMIDVVRNWHGLLRRDEIIDASVLHEGHIISTKRLPNKLHAEGVPELDLLLPTLEQRGVMQLESSRGCTYACSFCPRAHKGMWSGYGDDLFERVMADVARAYDAYPHIARKIFLVDEEYVGYRDDSEQRGLSVARRLKEYGFKFETSTRVDQVVRPLRDRNWHLSRMQFWSDIVDAGLDRCLFGVESGVASILKRFNKKTTPKQNAQAIRVLSALDVPIRATYITFDQLMTMDELVDSYVFLGRRDLLLRPSSFSNYGELYDIVTSDDASREHASGKPFYSQVSYMLVTMEALIGSKYLTYVEEAGLAGEYKLSMGCRKARFIDPRIEAISDLSQKLIDRNFSLDYMLKSLQKISNESPRRELNKLRIALRQHCYRFLGYCIYLTSGNTQVLEGDSGNLQSDFGSLRSDIARTPQHLDEILLAGANSLYQGMMSDVENQLCELEEKIPADYPPLIRAEIGKSRSRGWRLINEH